MSDYRMNWSGRPVVFGDFDMRRAREVRDAQGRDFEESMYLCLAYSLRYADTQELVFASPNEIWNQSTRLQQRLLWLSGEALRINGFTREDPDAPPAPNGHDRAEGAGHPSL